jgi:putative transposase
MNTAGSLSKDVSIRSACDALAVPRASFYRWRGKDKHPTKDRCSPAPPLTLTNDERKDLLDILHGRRFVDQAPREVYSALLNEGIYLSSVRTMYRILEENQELRERGNQLRHPSYKKPDILATALDQVWSWDITKLKGPVKWMYYCLYIILDISSPARRDWMVAHGEQSSLARKRIEESCEKQGIQQNQLIIHADRGAGMTSKPVTLLLADLGVTKTDSRPYTSNDNPYSESQFKTMKYRPEFPEWFGAIEDARSFCQGFLPWYTTEHYHSDIGFLTPEDVHYGRAEQIIKERQAVLNDAFAKHPERFKGKMPKPTALPEAAWINKPVPENSDPARH